MAVHGQERVQHWLAVVNMADFQKLQHIAEELNSRLEQKSQENRDLQAALEQQVKEIHQKTQELEIKNEALRKQSAHQKQIETELLFMRAALADEQAKANHGDEEGSWQERYLRLQAELENLRKRLEQRAESADNRRKVLADMLPLADHLDLALQHQPPGGDAEVRNFISNIDATRRGFLRDVAPLWCGTDRACQRAIRPTPSRSDRAGAVAECTRRPRGTGCAGRAMLTAIGFSRPARVLVSTGPVTTEI